MSVSATRTLFFPCSFITASVAFPYGNTRYPNALNNLEVDSRTDGSSSTTRIALFSSWFIFRVPSANHCVSSTSLTFLASIVGPNGFCKNGMPAINTKESWIPLLV